MGKGLPESTFLQPDAGALCAGKGKNDREKLLNAFSFLSAPPKKVRARPPGQALP
jgi:hypothetical protein